MVTVTLSKAHLEQLLRFSLEAQEAEYLYAPTFIVALTRLALLGIVVTDELSKVVPFETEEQSAWRLYVALTNEFKR